MKTFGGWGGRSATSSLSMGVVGLALALIVGVFVLPGEASGGIYGGGLLPPPPGAGSGAGPGDGNEPPPKPPGSAQDCFDKHLRNQERCRSIWCEPASFIWISWTSCQDRFLTKCIDAAELAYQCCLAGGTTPCPEG